MDYKVLNLVTAYLMQECTLHCSFFLKLCSIRKLLKSLENSYALNRNAFLVSLLRERMLKTGFLIPLR